MKGKKTVRKKEWEAKAISNEGECHVKINGGTT